MADYGLEVKDSSGNIIVDTTQDSGWTLIDSWEAPDTGNASRSYPEWSGYTILGCGFVIGAWAGHHLTTSGTTVTATRIVLSTAWTDRTNATRVFVFVR